MLTALLLLACAEDPTPLPSPSATLLGVWSPTDAGWEGTEIVTFRAGDGWWCDITRTWAGRALDPACPTCLTVRLRHLADEDADCDARVEQVFPRGRVLTLDPDGALGAPGSVLAGDDGDGPWRAYADADAPACALTSDAGEAPLGAAPDPSCTWSYTAEAPWVEIDPNAIRDLRPRRTAR